jgi:hypothetical protein
MGVYKVDDVAAINNPYDGIKCIDCVNERDWIEVADGMIITYEMIQDEEVFYFCDSCKRRII